MDLYGGKLMCHKYFGYVAATSMFFIYAMTDNAYAYLDPGTGSILLQGLIGGVAGGLVVIRLYWHKFKNVFKRSDSKKTINH